MDLIIPIFNFIFAHIFTLYRNEGPVPYGNIMYDKRIVRGNTYAQHTLPAVILLSFGFPNPIFTSGYIRPS